jgi:hypothetical protein
VPNRITTFVAGFLGKAWAHESIQELNKELDKRADQMNVKRWAEHQAGAARLDSTLDFQPGLVVEHVDMHDSLLYIRALMGAAYSKGHGQLGDELRKAEGAIAAAMHHLAGAAVATIPASEIPVASS